jgi:predicted permease
VLAFALGTSLLTSIIFSLAPALQTSRLDVNRAIKEGADRTHVSTTRWRLRGALVVVEIALAFALTVGAGLLLRTFANLRGIEPGFDSHNLLTFEISPKGGNYDTVAKTNDFYNRALERFQSLPGVEAAALTNKLPLDWQFNLPYRLAGQNEVTGAVQFRLISGDYFRVMNMTLQQGRSFSAGDSYSAEPVVIVNAAFARRSFSGIDPLGRQLCVGCKEFGDPSMRRIVGVVNDTKQSSLSEAAPAMVFIPLAQAAEGIKEIMQQSSFVLRTSGDPLLLSGTIRSEMRQLDPNLPVRNLRSMEQLIGRSIAPQRFNLSLLSLFAALGLLLAAVGIYGVMAYSVSQRTHEFGIRMALGAQTRDVLKLIMRQGMVQALIGVGIGLFSSLSLTRLMKSLLFGVSPTDPLTFALIALLLTTVALLACYIPARRAARVNPLTALRYE